ncbi:MAG: glycoside hydrolase [Actinophytocola sp.]|uniref:C40 family peptidase n=1 Tax=Actinophytocola sp. TaxID=1872138 RepID=UPI00132B4650|nr:C40 family peptidase [Actinophytocola sp.]MPZ82742.1 glycoside hydrolase [Actinophytocola sp.]
MRGVTASLGGVVVLAATLLVATLLVAPMPAVAQPTTVAGLLAHYQDLSREAERVNEELLIVQESLTKQQEASAEATWAAEDAKAVADAARGKVNATQDLDKVAEALSSRRDLDALSAFATSTSPGDLLGKLEAVSLAQHLTGGPHHGDATLAEAEAAEEHAATASAAADAAEAKVADGAADVQSRRADLDRQIAEVRAALDNLTPDQRSLLAGIEDYGSDVVIPRGNIGGMLQFALGQLGKPYLWGAVGPSSYDCSGLVQTAFRAAGLVLPRVSRQQATVGRQVARTDVRAGDLIFYYQPVHHVAIAVDNVRAVHAPSFGETVKIGGIDTIGPITVIRRVIN